MGELRSGRGPAPPARLRALRGRAVPCGRARRRAAVTATLVSAAGRRSDTQLGPYDLRPAAPVDVLRTLGPLRRGAADPSLRVAADRRAVWRCCQTPAGPATLHLALPPGTGPRPGGWPVVRACGWGPGAGWALETLPVLLGTRAPAVDVAALFPAAPRLLHAAARAHPGLRLVHTGAVTDVLAAAVLEQKVTGAEAHASWARLLRWFGTPAPGPAGAAGGPGNGPGERSAGPMRVPPSAADWQRIPSWSWHRAGVGPQRAAALVRVMPLAAALDRGPLPAAPALAAALLRVPGIGAWTVAETVQRSLGDPDTVSVGDYHLAAFVGWALAHRPVDDAQMLQLLAPYAGHRQRVVRLLELSGARKPRFGPRYAGLDHRAR